MPESPPSLRFACYRDIAAEVAECLVRDRANPSARGADPLRGWTLEVLVPSSGVAQAIGDALLARIPNGVAGVRIQTLETLARRLLNDANEYPRVASDAERRLAMRTAVRTVEHPMMEGRGVAAMLERSYRDVRDGGIALDELRKRAGSARGLRNPERTRLLIRVWSEYERLIGQLGAIDPAALLTRAAKCASTAREQLLAGFYDMTRVQWEFVDALRAAGKLSKVWIPTTEAFAQPFMEHFRSAMDEPPVSDRKAAAVATALLNYDTRDAELRAVAREIRALLDEGIDARDVGIVARAFDPYDARLIERFAREHGFSTTLANETPLIAHRIGRGVASLLRIRERGFPRAEVLELVRAGMKTKTRINVDRADAETRRARIAGGTSEELRTIRRRSLAVDDYIALVAELEDLTARIDLGRLTSLFRIDTDADLQAAEAIDEIADLFKRASVWNQGLDIPSVLDALENSSIHCPPPTAHRPLVWSGDVMRFRGRSFAHLFVVRMQDDRFPQRRNEDPLVPDGDRRLLGIREIGDGADEEHLLFQLLHDATTTALHFSYAAGDGFGKVLRPSRFVRNVSPADGAAGSMMANVAQPRANARGYQARTNDNPDTSIPRYSDTRQPRNPATPQPHPSQPRTRALQLLAKSGTRSVFDGYLSPDILRERIGVALQSVTPTQLEDFGECPQKFLLKHILGVVDIDDPERELQIHHRDKGTIDHRILERFYRGWSASAGELDRLDAIIDDEFATLEKDTPPFNRTVREIERRATKRILRDFVISDLGDLAATGLEPKFFEYKFGTKWRERGGADRDEAFIVNVRSGASGIPVRVEGQIDRIDVGPNRFRIVDYKSGQALRHKNLGDKIDRGVRLQLALYAMAVSEFFGVDASQVSGTIKPLVVGDGKGKFAFDLAEKRDGLGETLSIFIDAILRGAFPAFPNDRDDDFNSCKYCPVNHSCRTKHDPEEKYAMQQKNDPRTLLSGSGVAGLRGSADAEADAAQPRDRVTSQPRTDKVPTRGDA